VSICKRARSCWSTRKLTFDTNALSLADPELQKLCRVREDARALRNQLLNQRADLLRRAGKVR